MFLGDFHPFGNSCPSLSLSQNFLCSAVFEFIENDAQIYTSQRHPIEKALLERIKNGSYDNIPATKAFENLLVSHKKYIVESLNKIKMFVATHGKLTTLKLNKKIRRHICCLLVNNFLEDNEDEIKQLTDEGEPEQPEEEEEEDEEEEFENMEDIPDNWNFADLQLKFKVLLEYYQLNKKEQQEKKEEIKFSWCGRCECTLKNCICYSPLVEKLDYKINILDEELKGAKEIINSQKPLQDEANKEINKLKSEYDELYKKANEREDIFLKMVTACKEIQTKNNGLNEAINYFIQENEKIKQDAKYKNVISKKKLITEKNILIDLLSCSQFHKYCEAIKKLDV